MIKTTGRKTLGASITLEGHEELSAALTELAPKHARNLMRAVNHGIASRIAKRSKQGAPVGDSGKLRRSIKAKRKKSPPDRPVSEVHSEVYYWRFVEYGTGGGKGSHIAGNIMPNAQPFIRPVVDAIRPEIPGIMREEFVKRLTKMLARENKKRAKK